jgi:hypothetical protein
MEIEQGQVEKVREYLKALREEIRKLAIFPRSAGAVFDSVACTILSKTCSLADAVLILIESGHSEEAYGLARSIFECSLNLRYMTQDQDQRESRARDFANYFYKERQYWYAQGKQVITDQIMLAEMDQYAADNGIVPNARPALAHWSGLPNFVWQVIQMDHPLDGTTYGLTRRKADYAVAYHATSAYVHASYHAIHGYLVRLFGSTRKPYQPNLKSDGDRQEGLKSLFTILDHVHQAVRYMMFGMEVADTKEIDRLFGECLSYLVPVGRMHRPENVYRKVYS